MNVLKRTLYEEKYKYFHCGHSNCCLQLSKNDTTSKHFISVNSDNKILGYICYEIYGISNIVGGLSVINFSDEKLIFGKDLVKSIDDIFRKFKYRKLEFSAVVGNLIIDNYDKLCLKYGGEIVGI